MQYKIIVDKQPSSNPSDERKEYTIDIEELRVKGSVYDSINITPDRTYVTRRLTLSEYGVLSELVPSQEEDLGDLNIELFEGDNYIYLYEMTGNRFCAEYVVKNDFTDTYVTNNQMNSAINQSAKTIEISVNQKLKGYSTTEEMRTAIKLSSNTIMLEVNKKVGEDEFGTQIQLNYDSVQIAWNNISEYIQLKNAQLQVLNNSKNMLMCLDKTGQHFYENNGELIGDIGIINYKVDNVNIPMIAFNLNITETNSKGMAWGIQKNNNFYPIFYVLGTYAPEQSEYGGKFTVAGEFEATNIKCANIESTISITGNTINTNEIYADKIIRRNTSNRGIIIRNFANSNRYYEGYALTGTDTSHTYQCAYISTSSVTDIAFYVDGNYIGGTSDKRLKSNIENVNEKIIKAIDNINYYQFNTKKDPNAISVGIMAQELEAEMKKEGLSSKDYTILSKFIYNLEDTNEYYKVDYEQFLLLKLISFERKLKQLQEIINK